MQATHVGWSSHAEDCIYFGSFSDTFSGQVMAKVLHPELGKGTLFQLTAEAMVLQSLKKASGVA